MKKIVILGLVSFLVFGFNLVALANGEEGEDGFEEQQFLFKMEEAYVQEQGEWQISLSQEIADHEKEIEFEEDEGEFKETIKDTWATDLEVEYGITDRVQVEVETTLFKYFAKRASQNNVLTFTDESGIGDTEIALAYALIAETDILPMTTIGFEVGLPTGNRKKGLSKGAVSVGPSMALSKIIGKWVIHLGFGYEIMDNATEEGKTVDIKEAEYGVALVYRPNDEWDFILELAGENEKLTKQDVTNHEDELYFTPGAKYKFEEFWNGELEIGAGIPIGITEESSDVAMIVKVIYEF